MSVRHLNGDAQQTNRNIGVEMGERFGSHQLTDPSIGTDETAHAKKSKTCSSSETPTFKGIVKKKKRVKKSPQGDWTFILQETRGKPPRVWHHRSLGED